MLPLVESQHHVIDPTNPGGALDDGVEDRLHVRRRAADDAEHLGGRRLMLQGLAQFRVALAEFPEQAHVLDGDDRLVGEGFEKRDLFVGEWANFQCGELNDADAMPSRSNGVASMVRVPSAAEAHGFRNYSRHRCREVMNVDRLPVDNRTADCMVTVDWNRYRCRWTAASAVMRDQPKGVAIDA